MRYILLFLDADNHNRSTRRYVLTGVVQQQCCENIYKQYCKDYSAAHQQEVQMTALVSPECDLPEHQPRPEQKQHRCQGDGVNQSTQHSVCYIVTWHQSDRDWCLALLLPDSGGAFTVIAWH